jgi:flagellar hook-length control protein FliK
VTRQVFPEVTRLVSTGNGTHHVRLQLEPEALGDVRVVLTVRQGEVHVRLSAGEEAQRALREGAPELRRLLELAGASDTRIVVRDLPSGSAPGNGSNTSLTGQWSDGSGRGDTGVGQGDGRSQHQHAGTRDGSSAREGTNDGAGPHRPVQPVTRTRPGVDVTM